MPLIQLKTDVIAEWQDVYYTMNYLANIFNDTGGKLKLYLLKGAKLNKDSLYLALTDDYKNQLNHLDKEQILDLFINVLESSIKFKDNKIYLTYPVKNKKEYLEELNLENIKKIIFDLNYFDTNNLIKIAFNTNIISGNIKLYEVGLTNYIGKINPLAHSIVVELIEKFKESKIPAAMISSNILTTTNSQNRGI